MYLIKTTEDDMFIERCETHILCGDPNCLRFKRKLNNGLNDVSDMDIIIKNLNSHNIHAWHLDKYVRIVIFKSNKIIVSDKYNAFNSRTIMKLNIEITARYIDMVGFNGNIKLLEWLKMSKKLVDYKTLPKSPIIGAAESGNINVLEWWKNSGLELKYDEKALMWASYYGNINVLEWWKNSGLELKYDMLCVSFAALKGHINVLEWWEKSGLFPKGVMFSMFSEYPDEVREWLMNSKLNTLNHIEFFKK